MSLTRGAIVVGTSGVVAYSPSGTRLWWAAYPGVAFDVVTDTLGDAIVAGDGGLVKYASDGRTLVDPSGREVGRLEYTGRADAVAVDPTGKPRRRRRRLRDRRKPHRIRLRGGHLDVGQGRPRFGPAERSCGRP